MKRFVYLLIILLTVYFTQAQTRFNKRINFGFAAQYMTSIVATDSCYYVTGNDIASTSPWRDGIFFAIFDKQGELLSIKTYDGFSGKVLKYFQNKMFYSDGFFYCSGHFVYSADIRRSVLLKFTTSGDTVFVNEYPSFLEYETFHSPSDGIRSFDGSFYLTSNLYDHSLYKTNADIIKIDPSGEHIWSKLPLEIPDSLERLSNSLVQLADSTIVISTNLRKPGYVKKNFIRYNQLIRVDSSGSFLNNWTSPQGELRFGVQNDIIQTQDGGMAFTMSFGTEYFEDSLHPIHEFLEVGGICKLNSEFEEDWAVNYPANDPHPRAQHHQLYRLIELEDGSLVAVGKYFESYVPDSVWLEDYEMWDYWNYNGWILKVSSDGDSIWSRQYHHVVSPADEHFITDIEETEDGGFIMCGQAGDMLQKPPPGQQAWLIKTDQYGCIVPGCQVSIEVRESNEDYLSIYPNPAKDYLNIFLQRKNNIPVNGARGRLIDLNGNVITEFSMWQSDLTYILPVYNYSAGTYIFQYTSRNRIISSKKVIIIN